MMNEETWFDGSEAVDKGFATQTEDNEADTPTAFDYRLYAHAPERLVAMAQPMTARARAATTEATRSPQSKGNDMDYKAVTMADLRAQRPDLVSAIEAAQDISGKLAEAKAAGAAEAKATGDAEKKTAGEQAAKAERERIEGIRAAAFEGQDELIKACIADGSSIGEAAQKLNADYKAKGAHLASIKNGEKHLAGLGAAPNAGGDAGGGGKKASTPEEWKAEYAGSDKLKADFPTPTITSPSRRTNRRSACSPPAGKPPESHAGGQTVRAARSGPFLCPPHRNPTLFHEVSMTTLAANKMRAYEGAPVRIEENPLPVIASDIIYEGAAVGVVDGTGHGRPLVAGDRFAGFANQKADNAAGAAAAISVDLKTMGYIQLPVTGAVITDRGLAGLRQRRRHVQSSARSAAASSAACTASSRRESSSSSSTSTGMTDPYGEYSVRETLAAATLTLDIEDRASSSGAPSPR
jgi:hypothetical protein